MLRGAIDLSYLLSEKSKYNFRVDSGVNNNRKQMIFAQTVLFADYIVDGNWAAWKDWGRCSRSCGGGTQVRSRTCTNPPPAFRGLRCPGSSTESQSCNEDIPCPSEGLNKF